MNISRFNYINLAIFFILIAVLAGLFYSVERDTTLHYIAERTNQDVYRLEIEIQKSLQKERFADLQSMLDQYSAVDPIIKKLSISIDGKTVSLSSLRSSVGYHIEDGYAKIDDIVSSIKNSSTTKFVSEVEYYVSNHKKIAYLYVDLDSNYLFSRLNKIAFLYGGLLFFTLFVVAIVMLNVVRFTMVDPILEVTKKIFLPNPQHKKYYIEEIGQLDEVLCNSIGTATSQKKELQSAYDEVLYLDGILQIVADINHLLFASNSVADLLKSSCDRLVENTNYKLCFIALAKEDYLVVEAASQDIEYFVCNKMSIKDITGSFVQRSARENKVCYIDLENESLSTKERQAIAKSLGYKLGISIPIISDIYSDPLGVMVLFTTLEEFKQKEVELLVELAGDIGFAIRSFKRQDELHQTLYFDAITKLPNRVLLTTRLADGKFYALSIINIDRFSEINEVYGVSAGDEILAKFAKYLSSSVSSFAGVELYKLNSDEFVLLQEECSDIIAFKDMVSSIVERSKHEVFVVDGVEIIISVSAGIAYLNSRVLEYASLALKRAKGSRKSVEVFTYELKKDHSQNIIWYKKIKRAIEQDRIVPYFQPIVSNRDGTILKYEALVRLIDEDDKVVSPFFFLDIAKKTKLYSELTKIMIDKTIETFMGKNTLVSINLSSEDLTNKDLANYLQNCIVASGMGKFMEFEILESEGIENYESVKEFVERFKNLGCRFAIDDFGSGYSNFDHLLKLNIDTLKIDASLIKNLPHDVNARIFVRHICQFAHEINVFVIAEFVSSEEILEQVKSLGIDASQGFYFYEPSPDLVEA